MTQYINSVREGGNKKFFDINSGDTFNRHDWFWCMDPMNPYRPPVVFPKWLTTPIHYCEKGTWAGITRSIEPQFSSSQPVEGVGLTLERLGYKPHPKQKEFLESEEGNVFYSGGLPSKGYYSQVMRRFMDPKYPIVEPMASRLENDFKYHAPKEGQQERYIRIRNAAKELAIVICENTPPSREQSVALTDLDKVVMVANAAIARNE